MSTLGSPGRSRRRAQRRTSGVSITKPEILIVVGAHAIIYSRKPEGCRGAMGIAARPGALKPAWHLFGFDGHGADLADDGGVAGLPRRQFSCRLNLRTPFPARWVAHLSARLAWRVQTSAAPAAIPPCAHPSTAVFPGCRDGRDARPACVT